MTIRDPQIANGVKGANGLGFDGVTSGSYYDSSMSMTAYFVVNKIGAYIVGTRIRAIGLLNGGWVEGTITAINDMGFKEFVVAIDNASYSPIFDYQWNITVAGSPGTSGSWSSVQPIRNIITTSDYPSYSDVGALLTIETSSGNVTITIDSNLNLSAGQRIDFIWLGSASSVTFLASSVTLNGTPGLKLRARYSAATLVCLASNTYVLVGDLSA